MNTVTSLSIITGIALNAVKVAEVLRTAEWARVEWVIEYWNGDDILSVVPWDEEDLGQEWALHIDLSPLKKPGEEMYIPFYWHYCGKPSLVEAISNVRSSKAWSKNTDYLLG